MWLECTEEQKQKLQSVLMNRNTVVVKDDDNDRVMELLKIFFKLRTMGNNYYTKANGRIVFECTYRVEDYS